MSLPIPGAVPQAGGTRFRVWAPRAESLQLQVEGGEPAPMRRAGEGWHELVAQGVRPGARYRYRFPDGRLRPDPASRLQEESVHGPSTVVDLERPWADAGWRGVPLRELATYELHLGTFTPEGTLEAAQRRLGELRALGVTAVELMPVAAFEGSRGWGYDGVALWAVSAAYGGPAALQRFVEACHALGLAAILDVVYNHLGPSGNYLREFGPYFTDRHQTPWGEAVNYDGPDSGPVRAFAVENALSWIRDFHFDGLRLDAVHGIADDSPVHVVAELTERAERLGEELGRVVHVIAESDLNDPAVVRRRAEGGWGSAAQWCDDFHHALHTLLTGERAGYYADFGTLEDFAKAWREPFVMDGRFSRFRGKAHGAPARDLPGRRFVVAAQNHDQIGNRALGDRLSEHLSPAGLRLAAAATILSPYLPLLFMGEEYGETAPFQFFTSFTDPALGKAVTEGRRKEFEAFAWKGQVPDPQAPETFERSRIDWGKRRTLAGASMVSWYRELLRLRRELPSLRSDKPADRGAEIAGRTVLATRSGGGQKALLLLAFSMEGDEVALPAGGWKVAVDSWARAFAGENRHAIESAAVQGRLRLGPHHAVLLVSR